jgi:hypothetical protein
LEAVEDMKIKKPWSKPEVRRLPITDELLDIFARDTRDERRIPVKRAK